MKRSLPFLLLSLLASPVLADTFTVVLQPTNGYRVPRIIGASGSIDSTKGFSGYDYFEWFGITHHRHWFKPSFSPLNPTGGVTNVASFNAAVAAVRANPWCQGTASDVYFDWSRFNSEFDANQRFTFQRFGQLGIVPMMCNTVFTDQDPLADWGNKFKYWKFWYAYVYFFASQYGITMYEFRNEANAWGSYAQWESHWLVCADAMRKAMADVNRDYGKNLAVQICGPTMPGPYWDYNLPDPTVDVHGWGSVAWKKIHTDIYGNQDPSIWNFGMYDYHRYRTDGSVNQTEIATLRQNIANATNAPNATIPLLISEYNTSTGANFTSKNLDTEDLAYGIATAQILQATAALGPAGLGDEGGFFLFKLGAADGSSLTLQNKTAYVSAKGDYNYGGVTRGGVCFQMYARHFRGGKPLLGYNVTSGSSSQRRVVAVLDEQRRAYYVYFSNVNGTSANAVLDLSALDVAIGTPVTVQRVDANNTGQITDYLAVDSAKKVTFSAPDSSAFLVWIPKGSSAGSVTNQPPADDTYLVVGEATGNHGAEPTMKVSLHHSTPTERRLGLVQFSLTGLSNGNRYLLKLAGHNIGTNQTAREILHVYGRPGAGWTSTNLTWAAAPGVGKYYTSTSAMSTTTGLGSMTDIEDNYGGITKGTGLGLYGKFLGPISFYSSDWKTNHLDVTDYVRSLLTSNTPAVTFVIARVVRYDVNQYSNATYYTKGVYDSDGRIVEIASLENTNAALRPTLVVFNDPQAPPGLAISPISDRTILPNTSTGPIPFTLSGGSNATYYLAGSSSNPLLLPVQNIVFGGSGTNRTVTLTPLPNENGAAGITLVVNNAGGQTASTSFTLTVSSHSATQIVWNGPGAGAYNWSNTNYWLPSVSPEFLDDVNFFDPGALGVAVSNVNSVVDAAFGGSIASLRIGNTNGNHTIRIADGQALNLVGDGGLLVGTETDNGSNQNTYATFTGQGGSLTLANENADLVVRQGCGSSGSQSATLNLSGLGNFYADVDQVLLGVYGAVNHPAGTLLLARTNTIFAAGSPGIEAGECHINGGPSSYLYLGLDNEIYADTITIGGQKSTAAIAFNPAFTNTAPQLWLRGFGPERVSQFNIGDFSAQSTSGSTTAGTVDFTGGSVDALVDTLFVGKGQTGNGVGSTTGILTLQAGTLDVNTLEVAYQNSSNALGAVVGTLNVNGSASVIVNSMLRLARSAGSGTLPVGTLNLNGGTVTGEGDIIAGGGTSTLAINGGLLGIGGTVGTLAAPIGKVALTNATLQLSMDVGAVPLVATSLVTGGSSNLIDVISLPAAPTPTQLPLIAYSNAITGRGFNFTLRNPVSGGGFSAYLSNNLVGNSVDLVFVSLPATPPRFSSVSPNGTNLAFSGSNGIPNWPYLVLATTNITLPLGLWFRLATNAFDPSGSFAFADTQTVLYPRRYYRLMIP